MNYFLINSNQLQMFDVEEAVENFKLDRDNCIIVVRRSSLNGSKIAIRKNEDLRCFYDWRNIEFIEPLKFRFRHNLLKFPYYIVDLLYYTKSVEKLISKYGKPTTIILGNYKNEGMRNIANSYKSTADIIFLDEGNTTVQYLNQRFEYFRNGKKPQNISAFIKKKVFNLTIEHPEYPIKFFTVYNGSSNENTNVINHGYERNRANLLKSFEMIDKSAFIASILVEFKIVTRPNYVALLKNIKSQYGDYIYFAHPKEKDEDLLHYKMEVGIKIKRLEIPIEMYFLNNSQVFKNLITFQSSAIINLSKIFSQNINYHVLILPEELIISDKNKIQFRELYENFKKNELLSVSDILF